MKRFAIKALIVAAVLVVLGFAFIRSVRSSREAAYTVPPAHLQQWTFSVDPGTAPTSVLISLRPPREMAATLFRQLFTRHAESFNGPTYPYVPVLLQDEFNRSFAGKLTAGEILELARGYGLEEPMSPRCMAYRRDSAPGVTRQLYFVVFRSAAFQKLRAQLARMAIPDSGFDPEALSPLMFVAASDANFAQWLPLRATDDDCVAPISVESGN